MPAGNILASADAALNLRSNIPIALVEEKYNTHEVGVGMQQGLAYADPLDIPFVFSLGGNGFVFHDRTGQDAQLETSLGLNAFPPPIHLWARCNSKKGLDSEPERIWFCSKCSNRVRWM